MLVYESRQACVGVSGEEESGFYMNKGQVAEDCFAPWCCWPTTRLRSLPQGPEKKLQGPPITSQQHQHGSSEEGLVTEGTG